MTNTEIQKRDVVEFEVEGETITGVVTRVDGDVFDVQIRRGAFKGKIENDDLYIAEHKTTAYVVRDLLAYVGTPDVSDLHPNNTVVDDHIERL